MSLPGGRDPRFLGNTPQRGNGKRRETKLETKSFPAGNMGGLLANRMGQGNDRETANGNERTDFGLTKAAGKRLIYGAPCIYL